MGWRKVGRFRSYEVDTPGIGKHQQEVKERGHLCGQLLAFDLSHVTSLFIFPTMPRCGDTIVISIFSE